MRFATTLFPQIAKSTVCCTEKSPPKTRAVKSKQYKWKL